MGESRPEKPDSSRHTALNRLKLVGFGLPLACLLVIEILDYFLVTEDPVMRAEHFAIAAAGALGVVLFAVLMFGLIERSEAQVIRQNRELTAINAVTTAVQGELAVEQIIDAALEVVLERTGATEASVVVFPRDQGREMGIERRVMAANHMPIAGVGRSMPHLIDIPLAHGTAVVGRMRLHLPEGSPEPDLLTAATLGNIGHQLASSIEIGRSRPE
jgi:hypothetical protein